MTKESTRYCIKLPGHPVESDFLGEKAKWPVPGIIEFDCSDLEELDQVVAARFIMSAKKYTANGCKFVFTHQNDTATALLKRFPLRKVLDQQPETEEAPAGMIEALGGWVYDIYKNVTDLANLSLRLLREFFRGLTPKGNFFSPMEQLARVGVQALPVVIGLSALFGFVVALMSSIQARQFSLESYVADLMVIGVVRELGPIMTAIILIARSGSSIAAELGTMGVTEELDALRVMGLPPERTLGVPRIFAMVFMGVILTIIGSAVMLLGGWFIGHVQLHVPDEVWLEHTKNSLTLKMLLLNLSKGAVFGYLIGLISINRGFKVQGGPNEVGSATTSAVVEAVVAVILVDSLYNVVETFVFG